MHEIDRLRETRLVVAMPRFDWKWFCEIEDKDVLVKKGAVSERDAMVLTNFTSIL